MLLDITVRLALADLYSIFRQISLECVSSNTEKVARQVRFSETNSCYIARARRLTVDLNHCRSERVKSVDFHPTEPWLLAGLYNGNVFIWNHETGVRVPLPGLAASSELTDIVLAVSCPHI